MKYKRMPIEIESPEELGYGNIAYNLSESSIADRTIADLDLTIPDLKLLYGEHRGNRTLRSAVLTDVPGLNADDVLITAGAAGALFIVSTSLLSPDDHLVVVRPNYATNLETPRAIGCEITFVDLAFEDGFRLNLDAVVGAVNEKTKLISITCPHNPTGVMLTEQELRGLVQKSAELGCILLVDETYSDIVHGSALPVAASLGDHVISVSSMSKSYGIPGIRIGWLISQNAKLRDLFLAAKEQISICGSVLDEWIAEQVMVNKRAILEPICREMRDRLDQVEAWIESEDLLEWVRPSGGVVCFPRMKREPAKGTDDFYRRLLDEHGTYVGRGRWFERPDTYFRLGYGWPSREELEAGMAAISRALRG
jgi:aspartate/methionine/tyrosine aminotransferase